VQRRTEANLGKPNALRLEVAAEVLGRFG
jgi:hypothetical protein